MERQTKKDATDEYRKLEQGIYEYYDALVRGYKNISDNSRSDVVALQRMSIDASIAIIDAHRAGSIAREEMNSLDNLLGTVFGIQDKLGGAWLV